MTLEQLQALLSAAQSLVDNIEFDVNGADGRGGHGGLTSNETLKAAGTLRQEIYRAHKAVEELPAHD